MGAAIPNFLEEKIVEVAEVNQWRYLEERGLWLGNVDRTHLVLAGGKLLLQKSWVQRSTKKHFIFNCLILSRGNCGRLIFFLLYFERVRSHALVVFPLFWSFARFFCATRSWLGQHLTHNFQVWKIIWETFLGSIFCLRALVVRNLSSTSNPDAAAVAHQLLPSLKGCRENWPKWELTEWKFA